MPTWQRQQQPECLLCLVVGRFSGSLQDSHRHPSQGLDRIPLLRVTLDSRFLTHSTSNQNPGTITLEISMEAKTCETYG